ncbi:unnamed protein product, partial [Phaeothamnion confervicola]
MEWSCDACTLDNSAEEGSCSVCGTTRPTKPTLRDHADEHRLEGKFDDAGGSGDSDFEAPLSRRKGLNKGKKGKGKAVAVAATPQPDSEQRDVFEVDNESDNENAGRVLPKRILPKPTPASATRKGIDSSSDDDVLSRPACPAIRNFKPNSGRSGGGGGSSSR